MTGGRLIGFDPGRMVTLSARTSAAIEHLRGVSSDDPSAQAAMSRVASVRFELETLWMPAIVRVTGDRSMVGWDGEEPEPTPWDRLVAAPAPVSVAPPSANYLDEDHSYLIDVLAPAMPARTTGTEWSALAPWQQEWLLVNQPDVVMAFMLRHGNVLTEDQLDTLETANGFVEFSETFLAKFGIEVGVRWLAIELGSSSELRVTYLSDGTVEAVITQKDSLGLVVDVGEIEIGAGIYVRAGERLVFSSDEEAEEAIDRLVAASDVTLWDRFRFVANRRSDVQAEVERLWEEHGVEETDEVGGYLSAHAQINGALSLTGDARLDAGVYTTTDADGNVTRQGVRVAGSVSGSATGDGSTATGAASVVIDAHRDLATGEEFVTFTIATQGGGGVASSVADIAGAGVNVSARATQSTLVTTSITVPVNDDTVGDATEVIDEVLSGRVPTAAIEALYDAAEITIAVDEVSSATVGWAAGEGVEVESSSTVSHGENVVTLHKNPHGDMYSQSDLDAAIDEARQASDLPVGPPAGSSPDSSSGSW